MEIIIDTCGNSPQGLVRVWYAILRKRIKVHTKVIIPSSFKVSTLIWLTLDPISTWKLNIKTLSNWIIKSTIGALGFLVRVIL